MIEQIREAVLVMLGEMNYDTSEVVGSMVLGPEGLDLESLAVAELAVRIEDQFGVKFTDTEAVALAKATLDEFITTVAERVEQLPVGTTGSG